MPIKNEIFDISHSTGIYKVIDKLEGLNKIDQKRKDVLDLFYLIKDSPFLSEDNLFNIFKQIINSKTAFSNETKENTKKLRDEEIVNNTMGIIEVFERLNEITTDIDEKVHLERIYHQALLNMK